METELENKIFQCTDSSILFHSSSFILQQMNQLCWTCNSVKYNLFLQNTSTTGFLCVSQFVFGSVAC